MDSEKTNIEEIAKKHHTLGVIIPTLANHFFSTVINGIEDVVSKAGYHLIIAQSGEKYKKEIEITQMMLNHQVEGLLISLASETQDFAHFENLSQKIPLIFFDRKPIESDVNSIVMNNYQGAFDTVEHLIKMGCKNIIHLSGIQTLSTVQERLKGYEDALQKYKLDTKLMIPCKNRLDAFQLVSELVAREEKFDAIFATDDDLAIGALLGLKQNGVTIPNDVAVAAFGDDPVTTVIEPNLTSIAQPGYEMGRLAGQLLLENINQKKNNIPTQQKILDTKLIIRGSSNKI